MHHVVLEDNPRAQRPKGASVARMSSQLLGRPFKKYATTKGDPIDRCTRSLRGTTYFGTLVEADLNLLPRYFVSGSCGDHHVDLYHESRRIVVRQVESNLPMLVSAFEAPSLVESQAALQADYSDAPREGSLNSVSSVVPDSGIDPARHNMHEPPSPQVREARERLPAE